MLGSLKRRLGLRILQKYRNVLAEKPLDAEVHFNFATEANRFGLYNLANAELKNAEYLGFSQVKVSASSNATSKCLSKLEELDVNQYQRFKIFQTHLNKLLSSNDSILDIGGGHGILSQFVPENRYFLIDPSVNGISGLELPFPDNSFDAVVTCHVLEHINRDDRPLFIDELVRVAKSNVLILNPFKSNEFNDQERLRLILDVTNASWAKEHLECGLPILEETSDYISSQGLSFSVRGYGDIYASTATVFMSFFSGKSHASDMLKINQHLNQKYDQLTSGKYPTNFMVEISK